MDIHAASVSSASYGGHPSLVLRAAAYEAILLSTLGGHLISLRDPDRNLHLLREPLPDGTGDLSAYLEHPVPWGLPLLFPPNRIADGTFTFAGRTYRFPINEPGLHNHLHGFFARRPWDVVSSGAKDGAASVTVRYRLMEGDEIFTIFPHRMTLEVAYTLSGDGLHQDVRVQNDGDTALPFLLGFHTALNVPFSPDSSAADCTVHVDIGEQWELTPRKVPSGRKVPQDAMERAIAEGGGDPFAHPIDALFSRVDTDRPGTCHVTDHRLGVRLVYRTDAKYRNWMLWNGDARSGFFCPEPMTCLVNAPNLSLPAAQTGLIALRPGAQWTAESSLFLETVPTD